MVSKRTQSNNKSKLKIMLNEKKMHGNSRNQILGKLRQRLFQITSVSGTYGGPILDQTLGVNANL